MSPALLAVLLWGCPAPLESVDNDDDSDDTGVTDDVDDTDVDDPDDSDPTDTQDTEPEDTEPPVIIPDFVGNLSTVRTTITADNRGVATAHVDIPAGAKSFMITSTAGPHRPAVEFVRDPSGFVTLDWQDWQNKDESLTQAFYVDSDNVLNYPVRSTDPPLQQGIYEVDIAVVGTDNYYKPNAPVDVTVQIKSDSDLTTGTVHAEIFFTDPVDADPHFVQSVQSAVARWKTVWNSQGLALEESYWTAGLAGDMSEPGGADAAVYESLSGSGSDQDITVIVAETVEGGQSLLGIAGGIPMTLVSGPRAVMIVTVLNNAGSDGVFDSDDIRVMGETLAHEAGHYMGLFHPVEKTFDDWDALGDTTKCSSAAVCDQQLGDNLMYPYPVCSWQGCVAQDQLTTQQTGALHLYTGTL